MEVSLKITHRWNLPEGAIARLGKSSINDMKFSPDDSQLAVATDIGVWIYDAHTGAEMLFIQVPPRGVRTANTIAFAPDGKNPRRWKLGFGRCC